jgi:hypothetical protein
MTIDLTTITVMNDIRERLLAITDAEVAWAYRRLDEISPTKATDKVLGEVENPTTRALYVLSMKLAAASELESSKAKAALDQIMEDEHGRQAVLLHDLADASREIFWAQAKIDLNHYKATSLGVRANFVIISNLHAPDMFPSFLRGLAGGLPDASEEK